MHRLKSQNHLVQHNKQHYRKELLSSFHLNGHSTGFRAQTQIHFPQHIRMRQRVVPGQSWMENTCSYLHALYSKTSLRSVFRNTGVCESEDVIMIKWHWILHHFFLSFDHRVCFLMNILGKRSDLPFSRKSDRKKEESTVSFKYVHNINIFSQTQLEGIAHEQTIICRQLFAGHVVGSWPMKRKKNLLRMILIITSFRWTFF